jgi:hypothetical protein
MRTDGVDLEFIFDKNRPPATEPITAASFENWLNFAPHRTTIWGVDPGVTDIFVAADPTGEGQHRIRRTSSKEYYHECGYNKASEKRRRWEVEEGEAWKQLVTGMPTLKTTNLQQFLNATRYRLDNFARIVEPFDRDFRHRRLAFTTYRESQRAIHEFCRRLTYGSKKYAHTIS